MWEAVQRSDASYDGLFFYAVKTTGIFCRPSCRSKPPKREDLHYFASGEEARAAGFRPYCSVASLYLWAVAGGALPELQDYRPKTQMRRCAL